MSNLWSNTTATSLEALPAGVVQTWCSIYSRSAWAGAVPNNVADAVWTESIGQLLARGAVMHVAVNPNKPDHWLGYALTERTGDGVPVVHLAFTKPTYRRGGVFRSLLQAAGIDRNAWLFFTFKCGPESKLYPAGRYEPSIARRKLA